MKRKLTRLARERATQARLRLVTRKAVTRDKEQQGIIARLNMEDERKSKAIADKNQTIAGRDEEIRRLNERTKELIAERDRIVRLVDQFTSIRITSFQDSVNPQAGSYDNFPKNLRRT